MPSNKFKEEFCFFLKANHIAFESSNGLVYNITGHNLQIVLVCGGACPNQAEDSIFNTLYIYEDRWFYEQDLFKSRLLSRLGQFKRVFARKCSIEFSENYIDLHKTEISAICNKGVNALKATAVNLFNLKVHNFLQKYHSYGDAKAKYRYLLIQDETVVAAATFSAPMEVKRAFNGIIVEVSSYEWVRYASLPGIRVLGGMGKLLNAFINEVRAEQSNKRDYIEVMTYSDNEWSDGEVYSKLGFEKVGERAPIEYFVDSETNIRYNLRQFKKLLENSGMGISDDYNCDLLQNNRFYRIRNMGSTKYRYLLYNKNF